MHTLCCDNNNNSPKRQQAGGEQQQQQQEARSKRCIFGSILLWVLAICHVYFKSASGKRETRAGTGQSQREQRVPAKTLSASRWPKCVPSLAVVHTQYAVVPRNHNKLWAQLVSRVYKIVIKKTCPTCVSICVCQCVCACSYTMQLIVLFIGFICPVYAWFGQQKGWPGPVSS